MKIRTCAKLNLALDISGVRSDGYHDLRMIMQSVDLCDTVTAEFATDTTLDVSCSVPVEGENLVNKAVTAYSNAAGINIGGTVRIEKNIPMCGGLGGGSADAAAVLTALDRQFHAVGPDRLSDIALKLGADVPFALQGGTCFAAGVGEKLKPLPPISDVYVVLASGGVKDSTGKMFARFDALTDKPHTDVDLAVKHLYSGDTVGASVYFKNSFLPLWQGELVSDILGIMSDSGAFCRSLSGSGPTLFGLFNNEHDALLCQSKLCDITWSAVCKTTDKSVIFE